MKKLTTKIMDDGDEKEISVFLDDETAKVLEECGDEELKHRYIVEEYKDKLIERRETRRHQSLEKSIEGGHEFVDHKADVEQNLEKKEEIEQLYKALKFLTKKQMYVLRLHVLEQKTFQEISEIIPILKKAAHLRAMSSTIIFFRKAWHFRSIARQAFPKQSAFICADFRTRTEKTRSSSRRCIFSRNFLLRRLMRHIQQLSDDGILSMTSENDIDIANMDESPNALFVIVPDERFTRHRFVTLFLTQTYKELVEKANTNLRKKDTDTAILKRRAYFILDEFGNLPKMENIEGMVTVGRSRGIRYLFVLQSFSQLTAKYGKDIGDIIKTNCNVKIFIGSDDPDTRREFSELCGQKKVKNFSVNTNAENPASSNTGASNQPLITIGMLERLNGNEKGDAIVSVRGYEPIWSRFTPSYELKDVYFAAGKADISKREARLFDKSEYVFDILGGSRKEEEEKQLDAIERREEEQAQKEKEKMPDFAALDKAWNDKVKEVHEKILKVAQMLADEDAKALMETKLEHKQMLIAMLLKEYTDISTQQKLNTLDKYLSEELPKLLELQKQAKK